MYSDCFKSAAGNLYSLQCTHLSYNLSSGLDQQQLYSLLMYKIHALYIKLMYKTNALYIKLMYKTPKKVQEALAAMLLLNC